MTDLPNGNRDKNSADAGVTVAVAGLGYVGVTTAATFAYLGYPVIGVDVDREKIAALARGELPFYEPFLADLLALSRPRLRFTTDLAAAVEAADVIFITVGTPPREDGHADLSAVVEVSRGVGRALNGDYKVVVNKSTVPVGAGYYVETLVREAFRASHNGRRDGNFEVASNPEFLREGSAVADSIYPDRVVIGADSQAAASFLTSLYGPLLEQTFEPPPFCPRPEGKARVPLVLTDLASAETIKYAANAFLALKISFINEVAGLCERVGADVCQVARGIGLDSRIGEKFLQAGVGWGGSCFGKDLQALISTGREYGYDMPILQAALEVNRRQRRLVVEKLQRELKILKGRTIGLLGLAFKPHTDDLRDSPALEIARYLLAAGCLVKAHDPVAVPRCRQSHPDLDLCYADTPEEAALEADALVLVTDWPQYREVDWPRVAGLMRNRLIVDGRNHLDAAYLTGLGFRYIGVGK